VGYALYRAQNGEKHPDAKPLQGYTGAGVLEIAKPYDGDAYRVVYTVQFATAVYVLHAFMKKSTKGVKTQDREMRLVQQRLQQAHAIELERKP
jgi:phage-related protein